MVTILIYLVSDNYYLKNSRNNSYYYNNIFLNNKLHFLGYVWHFDIN